MSLPRRLHRSPDVLPAAPRVPTRRRPRPPLLRSALALAGAAALARGAVPGTAGQERALLLEQGLVHTMLPGAEVGPADVLVVDGRIAAVGPPGSLAPPEGAERVDVAGKHVVPGLIDGYVNFDPAHDWLYTVAGIALVRDVGGDHAQLLQQRAPERRARALGPDLLTAGAVLDGDPPSSAGAVVLRDPAAVEGLLPILVEAGVDFLSCLPGLDPKVLREVIEVGHEAGLEVWGPVPRDSPLADWVTPEGPGLDGVHFLDALLPGGVGWDVVQLPAFEGPAARLAETGVPVVPMFHASELRLENQNARPDTPGLLKLLAPPYVYWWRSELAARERSMTPEQIRVGEGAVAKQAELLARLFAAGVRLLPGSGSPQPWLFPGRALHEELDLWAAAGIPARDVLHAATRGAAEILDVAGRYGSIEPGAHATLLVLDEDPTLDPAALRAIDHLIVRGRVLAPDELDGLVAEVAERETRARAALDAELEVSPPPLPDGGVPILRGRVETRSLGLRLSVERFLVAHLDGGRVAFLGHIVYPHVSGRAATRDARLADRARGRARVGRGRAADRSQRALRTAARGSPRAGAWSGAGTATRSA